MSKRASFKAPTGTHDILPPDSRRWEALVVQFGAHCRRAGFGFIQTPTFEDLAVFARMGEGTEVVKKEMYDFEDRSDPPHHLALRPEGTAGVVRAFNQHKPTRANPQAPWKTWYAGANYRYERPQKGRQRQFHQFGVEAIGSDDPDIDVEIIALLWDFYVDLGLRHISLLLNTLGTVEERTAYIPKLQEFLRSHLDKLAPEDRDNVENHPMRVLDSKRRDTKTVIRDAPKLADSLSAQSRERFERVKEGLADLEIPFVLEPRLVRGLDYYTHTTFELVSEKVDAAQSTIGAGGRYDGLAEDLGGEPAPGIGFATGVERILLACDAEDVFPTPEVTLDVFVIDVVDGTRARMLTHQLRRAGIGADRAFDGRAMRSQMKGADRSGARFAIIIGDDEVADGEVTVRDLRGDGVQQRVGDTELINHLRTRLSDPTAGGVPAHFYVENRNAQPPPGAESQPASPEESAENPGQPAALSSDSGSDTASDIGSDTPSDTHGADASDAPEPDDGNAPAADAGESGEPETPNPVADAEASLQRAQASERLEQIRRELDVD